MDAATTRRLPARPLALPNILTYARIAAVPLVVGCMYWSNILHGGQWLRWVALSIFIAAAITDFFDGYLARAWGQQSTLGKMLDPIADKLLVASCLLMLAAEETIRGWSLLAAVVILCREILVSGLREFLASTRVKVAVTAIAKFKTAVQMIAIATMLMTPLADEYLPGIPAMSYAALAYILLWVAAALTVYTGVIYFRSGMRHIRPGPSEGASLEDV